MLPVIKGFCTESLRGADAPLYKIPPSPFRERGVRLISNAFRQAKIGRDSWETPRKLFCSYFFNYYLADELFYLLAVIAEREQGFATNDLFEIEASQGFVE